MSRSSLPLLLGAALALAACARPEPVPAASAGTTASAAGDVKSAPAAGMSGLTDSVSSAADRGRIRGSASARVWLIEVSDFQCPYCKQWHDASFAAIDNEYVKTGKVRLAYLNFPLSSIHAHARAAAEAAMCASVQGKFWELHESLFATQEKWEAQSNPVPTFDSLAVAAGVDGKAWRDCMTTHATAKLIDADHDRSRSAGVQSTPTFFIGDRKLEGAYPTDSFRVAIDSALAKAR
jgi:protein-disulfide isomerase